MFFTAAEARNYWCPMTQRRPTENESIGLTACLGAQCAAWRWKPATDSLGVSNKGFCGLAAKPQVWEEN